MEALVVNEPFIRTNPLTGNAEMHARGDQITHPSRVADILGSEHAAHVVRHHIADDHEHIGANIDQNASEE